MIVMRLKSVKETCGFLPVGLEPMSDISVALKGTVRPDWICMRVVSLKSPLKAHKPL
jgi:hypothetical protein